MLGVLAGCASEPAVITLHTGTPFVAAIDRGDGWEVLPDLESVELEVDGPFVVASVCGDITRVDVDVWMATASDLADNGGEWHLPCRPFGGDYHELTMGVAAGHRGETRVSLGYGNLLLVDDLRSTFELPAGTSDRLAVEQEGERRFVLLRDVELAAPGEWVIDFDRDGRPREPIEVITNLTPEEADGRLRAAARIWTDGVRLDLVDAGDDPAIVHVLPEDALVEEGEEQRVYAVYEWSDQQTAWASEPAGPSPHALRLPDLMAEQPTFATRGGLPAVSYDDDRDWADRRFRAAERDLDAMPRRSWSLVALQGWVGAAGVDGEIAFPDVTTIDGWQPGWEIGGDYWGALDLTTDPDADLISGLQLDGVSSP